MLLLMIGATGVEECSVDKKWYDAVLENWLWALIAVVALALICCAIVILLVVRRRRAKGQRLNDYYFE